MERGVRNSECGMALQRLHAPWNALGPWRRASGRSAWKNRRGGFGCGMGFAARPGFLAAPDTFSQSGRWSALVRSGIPLRLQSLDSEFRWRAIPPNEIQTLEQSLPVVDQPDWLKARTANRLDAGATKHDSWKSRGPPAVARKDRQSIRRSSGPTSKERPGATGTRYSVRGRGMASRASACRLSLRKSGASFRGAKGDNLNSGQFSDSQEFVPHPSNGGVIGRSSPPQFEVPPQSKTTELEMSE
jgi:hypothetical protein